MRKGKKSKCAGLETVVLTGYVLHKDWVIIETGNKEHVAEPSWWPSRPSGIKTGLSQRARDSGAQGNRVLSPFILHSL